MKTKKKAKWIILGVFLVLLTGGGLAYYKMESLTVQTEAETEEGILEEVSFNPENTLEIGYEFLDSSGEIVGASEGKTVHIWNTQDDYFFNKSSGIQFTNHFQDYWTRNVFCIGYYNEGEWVKINCADELESFNRNIHTDDLTYVNATLWKDITYSGYDVRLGLNYFLGINDSSLSITPYIKNIGVDIPFDLGFAWRIKDIEIPGVGEDYLYINRTRYYLNDTYNLLLTNLSKPYFHIKDVTKYLEVGWDGNLNYAVRVFGNGNQEDFYAILLINAGHFNPNQEKSTTFSWIDADTLVEASVISDLDSVTGLWGPYWIDKDKAIIMFVDGGDDISFARTTDGGDNWATTEIQAGTMGTMAAWFDKETPGDEGTLVHVAWLDDADGEAKYINIDVNDATEGTIRIVDSSINPDANPRLNKVAITKTVSGNIVYALSTTTEIEAYKSTDLFVSDTTAITDFFENVTDADFSLFFPADTGDDDDAVGVFWDRNESEISIKMWDNSVGDWTETLISGSMVSSEFEIRVNMDGAVRDSDNHILFAAHSAADTGGDVLKTWDLTVDDIDSPTVTAKTNVYASQDHSTQAAVLINQQNDDVYLGYIKGATSKTDASIVFHLSENGMGTWGGETAYSESPDDHRLIHGGRTITSTGGRVQWSFYDDDQTDIYVNLVNDIEIGPPAKAKCWVETAGKISIPPSCRYEINIKEGIQPT